MARIAKVVPFLYKDQFRYYSVPEVAVFTSFFPDFGMHTFRLEVFSGERGMAFEAAFSGHLSLSGGTGNYVDTCAHENENH